MKRRLGLILFLVGTPITVLVLIVLLLWDPLEKFGVAMPRPGVVEVTRLQSANGWTQGWPVPEARRFHHESQGTRVLPIAWFRALEVPTFNPLRAGERLADPKYLERFGFLYDPEQAEAMAHPDPALDQNAPGSYNGPLPIGFAIEKEFYAPYTVPPVDKKTQVLGLTCAACHTGRLDLAVGGGRTVGVLIEGGSSMINLGKFQEAVGKALAYTSFDPGRMDRFAHRVLANSAECPQDEVDVATIQRHVAAYIATGIAGQDYAKEHKLYPVEGGPSRTDALTLIGNRVFGLADVDNQTVTDAPVNFPHLWDTAWFDWVQYNASIRLPLARNVGEALGVGAAVSPLPVDGSYRSTVRIDNLAWMEDFLGGDEPLAPDNGKNKMLQPPRWADFVAAIQRQGQLAATDKILQSLDIRQHGDPDHGKALYGSHCESCHLPDRDTLRIEWAKGNPKYWEEDPRSHKKFLRLKVIDLSDIGTDQNQAVNFYRRFAVVPNPVQGDEKYVASKYGANPLAPLVGPRQTISAEEGLYRITTLLRKEFFKGGSLSRGDLKPGDLFDPDRTSDRQKLDRYRTLPMGAGPEQPLKDDGAIVQSEAIGEVIRANLGYKARPLDGVWATPPYLHNGSVPNLYQVLSPAAERSAQFYLGQMRFDPVEVGYVTDDYPNGFLMDTSLPGNSNGGHEFRNYSLEEFELALQLQPSPETSRDDRWRTVFSVGGVKPEQDRAQAARQLTREIMADVANNQRHRVRNDAFRGVRGVIGAKLEPDERRDLIAYLKNL